MASVTTREVPPYGTERTEFSPAFPRISWGAVFAGAVVALGIWAMLYALGLAVGMAVLDPDDPGTVKSSGIFTGIWGLITPLAALFVGGVVAARCSGVIRRLDGAIHGLVVWGLATVAGAWLVANLLSTLVTGAASVGRTALETGDDVARTDRTAQETVKGSMARAEQASEELRRGMTGTSPPARRDAIEAAEESGKAFGGMFGALFLGLIASIAGGFVGFKTTTGRREAGRMATAPTETAPPLATQREAYP
jgi:hypothetical protein